MNAKLVNIINKIFSNLHIYLTFIGVTLIISSFLIKEKNKVRKIKKRKLIRLIIAPFKLLLYMIQPKSKYMRNKLQKKLSYISKDLTIDKFYLIKILIPVLLIFLYISIYKTNLTYITKEIIESPEKYIENNLVTINYNEKKEDYKQKEWVYYKTVISNINTENIIKTEPKIAINNIKEILGRHFQLNETIAYNIAERLYKKILKIESYTVNEFILIIIMFTYFAPNFYLILHRYNKRKKYKQEIPFIKISTYTILSMKNTTVKDVLITLREVSEVYRTVITTCLNNYNSVKIGKGQAIMMMAEEVGVPHFRKLCTVLREASAGNKEVAIDNLKKDIEFEEREETMRMEDKVEKKTWVAIFIIAPTILLITLLLLKPFTLIYNF